MNFKKMLALVLALVMLLSFVACGGNKEDPTTTTTAAEETTTEAVVTTAEPKKVDGNFVATLKDGVLVDSNGTAITEAADGQKFVDESGKVVAEVKGDKVVDASGKTILTVKDGKLLSADGQEITTTEPSTASQGGNDNPSQGGNDEPTTKTPDNGFNSTDAAAVVAFYKDAAKKGHELAGKQTMKLAQSIKGKGAAATLLSWFSPIAESALKKNSTDTGSIPGNYGELVASDVKNASAKTTADGKYTDIVINLKEQTDAAKGDWGAGPVGHGVGVLGDVDKAITELGIEVTYDGGTIQLKYINAYIKARVDNATGKVISGEWNYDVDVLCQNIKLKKGLTISIEELTAVVNFNVKAS